MERRRDSQRKSHEKNQKKKKKKKIERERERKKTENKKWKRKEKKNPCTVAISPAQVRFRPEYPSSNRSIDSNFSSHFFKVDLLSLTCLSLGFFTVVSEIFFGLKKHYPESSTIVLSFCAVLFGVTQFLVLKTDSDLRALSDL